MVLEYEALHPIRQAVDEHEPYPHGLFVPDPVGIHKRRVALCVPAAVCVFKERGVDL